MRYATTLGLMLALLVWAGCGKGDKPADAGKGGAEAKKADAKKEEPAKAEAPKDVVKTLFEAMKSKGKDWLKDGGPCFTKKAREAMVLLAELEDDKEPNYVKFEIKDEKIDGDLATVKVSSTKKARSGEEETEIEVFVLKKEDGKWRVFKAGGEDKQEDLEAGLEELKKMKEMQEKK